MKKTLFLLMVILSINAFGQRETSISIGYGIDDIGKKFWDINVQNKYPTNYGGTIITASVIPYTKFGIGDGTGKDARGVNVNLQGGLQFDIGENLQPQITAGGGFTIVTSDDKKYNYPHFNSNLRVFLFKYFFINGGIVIPLKDDYIPPPSGPWVIEPEVPVTYPNIYQLSIGLHLTF